MNVLVYCKDFYPMETGFSIAFTQFCKAVSKKNPDIKLTVVTPSAYPREDVPMDFRNFEVITLRRRCLWLSKIASIHKVFRRLEALRGVFEKISWAFDIKNIWSKGRYSLILFESADDLFVMASLPSSLLKRLAIRFHSTGDTETARYSVKPLHKFMRYLIRKRVSKYCRVFFATSAFHLNFTKSFYFNDNPYILAERFYGVIPNTIDADVVPQKEIDSNLEHSILKDKINIITLGRMDEQGVAQKGFVDLIFALSLLPIDSREKINLLVIGEGSCRPSLENLVHSLAIDCVKFCGSLPNEAVRALLLEAEVIALCSRFEGQSMFAIEGMICSCAPLFTNTGALLDFAPRVGWRVPVQDIQAISHSLREIAEMDKRHLRAMGVEARAFAVTAFDSEAIGQLAGDYLRGANEFLRLT